MKINTIQLKLSGIELDVVNAANKLLKLDAGAKVSDTEMQDKFFFILTETLFRNIPATGTADAISPVSRLNDNILQTGDGCVGADAIGEYAEVDFGTFRYVSMYRMYGAGSEWIGGSGRWKIQHWNGIEWIDNTINIPIQVLGEWSTWAVLTTPAITTKIRLVCTTVDIDPGEASLIGELEMKG